MDSLAKKIGMVTLAIGEQFRQSVALCLQTHERYAERHGYQYFRPKAVNTNGRPPSWGKIVVLQSLMKEHPEVEYWFWLDADAMITNPHFKLEALCAKLDRSGKHMMLSIDGGGNLNLGVFLFRPSSLIGTMFDALWKQQNVIEHCWWEGAAFFQVYPQIFRAVLVTRDTNLFNSYIMGESPWRFGDFILHFAGIERESRQALADKVYQLVTLAEPLLPKP